MSERTIETAGPAPGELEALREIERRVLWLATRIVDYANHERAKDDELKVGGHQASSASMVSLMTALYFWDLEAADRVSVKPHASPVLHAVEYLLGRLDRRYLTSLRAYGGLQSYPSRTKDHFPVDYSTGSVGIGSAAPLFGALANRYVETHFGTGTGGRFISLLGDAELDEGNLWEALLEPQVRGLGNVLWIVDLNRQSLDRVVPIIKANELESQFEAAGWQVLELKFGRRLRAAYEREGGDLLRSRIDEMPNQLYQSLFGASEEVVVEALLRDLDSKERRRLARLLREYRGQVGTLIQDLGGHDLADVIDALALARHEPDRPTILFAYTIKGWGLPIAGRPLNHSALLTREQVDDLREATGLTRESEWDGFDLGSPEGRLCAAARARLDAAVPGRACADLRPAYDLLARPGDDLDPGGRRPDPARPLARFRSSPSGLSPSRPTSPSRRTSAAGSTRSASSVSRRSRRTTIRPARRSRGGSRRRGDTSSSVSRR